MCIAQFCRRHSATSRRPCFLRKVPLLKGLADAALLAAAADMAELHFAVRATVLIDPCIEEGRRTLRELTSGAGGGLFAMGYGSHTTGCLHNAMTAVWHT